MELPLVAAALSGGLLAISFLRDPTTDKRHPVEGFPLVAFFVASVLYVIIWLVSK